MREFDIVVVADTQVACNSPTDHLSAISRFIWDKQPGTVVHIGDHWDFPALSSYTTAQEAEGRRLADDLRGGMEALPLIMSETKKRNSTSHRRAYAPKLHFLMGNHENRLNRYIAANPVLEGLIDIERFIQSEGWEVSQMNDPVFVHDVCFSHYMENSQSGRPVGGGIENKLNKFPHSFVHGHQQQYQYGRRQNLLGRPHFGVCAGSFYMHDEGYRGANNTEIRGFVHLKAFENRFGFLDHDVEFVSLERLLSEY